jgi:pyruvate, water dikinase
MNYIKKFRSKAPLHREMLGGKGYSLALMYQRGISVPNGFIVLSKAFNKFIEDNKLATPIETILTGTKIDDMKQIKIKSAKIQELILSKKFPCLLRDEIMRSYDDENFDLVAVRSSATVEDGVEQAWAGQLDTFLNTSGEMICKNIQRCWASLFTPRAIFYRCKNNLLKSQISIAVVVQEMIQSEVSGIAFSVNPISQNIHHAIIEAGYGLGEAIVSNKITPDSYTIDKNSYEIVERYISTQVKRIVFRKKNRCAWENVPKKLSRQQKLSDKFLLLLTDCINQIEKLYGIPQDIEWALKSNKLFITQSRPITTLKH